MELSVVRFHQAGATSGQPWVPARPVVRPVVRPDNYLSQCPFILLNEEACTPLGEFPIRAHGGVIAMTLVLDGSVDLTDGTGAQWRLGQGDADFSTGRGGALRGATSSELGVKLLHLWINLPAALKAADARRQVVRHENARRADFGAASALVYSGALGSAAGPHATPWPVTVADLSLQAGEQASLPVASTERSFAYILAGQIELGRNRVHLQRGNIAWIERAIETGTVGTLPLRAAKNARILFFSSPVFGEGDSVPPGNETGCAPGPAQVLRAADGARFTASES